MVSPTRTPYHAGPALQLGHTVRMAMGQMLLPKCIPARLTCVKRRLMLLSHGGGISNPGADQCRGPETVCWGGLGLVDIAADCATGPGIALRQRPVVTGTAGRQNRPTALVLPGMTGLGSIDDGQVVQSQRDVLARWRCP